MTKVAEVATVPFSKVGNPDERVRYPTHSGTLETRRAGEAAAPTGHLPVQDRTEGLESGRAEFTGVASQKRVRVGRTRATLNTTDIMSWQLSVRAQEASSRDLARVRGSAPERWTQRG